MKMESWRYGVDESQGNVEREEVCTSGSLYRVHVKGEANVLLVLFNTCNFNGRMNNNQRKRITRARKGNKV